MPCSQLLDYLNENNVEYELTEHPSAYAAHDVAYKAGVPGRLFAKTVLVKLDGHLAMAVLPADSKIDFQLLRELSGARTISLAVENDFTHRFPQCELGAMPPFGPLFGMDVFVAGTMIRADMVSFNAGTHTEVLTLPFWEFERLVDPTVGNFSFRRLKEMESRY